MLRLSCLVKPIMEEYLTSSMATVGYLKAFKSSSPFRTNLYGEEMEVYNDGVRYYLFEGDRFFDWGLIDNSNLIQTIEDDIKSSGLVMLAFKHISEEYYLENLMQLFREQFGRELIFVLGYCMIKLEDGSKLSVREFFEFLYANGYFVNSSRLLATMPN